MKRYIVIVSATLLTLAPMKLLTMEQTLSKIDLASCAQEISEKYQNVTEIQDIKAVRTGIFETTLVIVQAGSEDVSTLKEQRKALRKRLGELQPKQPQEQIFDVSSPESDDETDSPELTTRSFYTKYEKAEQIIRKNKSRSLEFEQKINNFAQQKSKKVLEIQRLQQALKKAQEEDNNLGTQIATQQEEAAVAQEAIKILELKKKALKRNIGDQEVDLSKDIQETAQEVIDLKQELSELTEKAAIQSKKSEIVTKEKELKELKSAFEIVKKDLHAVHGKAGILAPLLFGLNLYSYNTIISNNTIIGVDSLLIDKNNKQTNQSSELVIETSEKLSFIAEDLATQSPTPTHNVEAAEIVMETAATKNTIEQATEPLMPSNSPTPVLAPTLIDQQPTEIVIKLQETAESDSQQINEDTKDK